MISTIQRLTFWLFLANIWSRLNTGIGRPSAFPTWKGSSMTSAKMTDGLEQELMRQFQQGITLSLIDGEQTIQAKIERIERDPWTGIFLHLFDEKERRFMRGIINFEDWSIVIAGRKCQLVQDNIPSGLQEILLRMASKKGLITTITFYSPSLGGPRRADLHIHELSKAASGGIRFVVTIVEENEMASAYVDPNTMDVLINP